MLQITGPEDSTDYASLKPDLTAIDQGGGKVELGFSKRRTDGVNIYVFDMELLGRFNVSAFNYDADELERDVGNG